MNIDNPKLTMKLAAAYFVSAVFDSRKIGKWYGNCFQLIDGVNWYRVTMTKTGWKVVETNLPPAKGCK